MPVGKQKRSKDGTVKSYLYFINCQTVPERSVALIGRVTAVTRS